MSQGAGLGLRCRAGLSAQAEEQVARSLLGITRAPTPVRKASSARALRSAAEKLLSCDQRDRSRPECRSGRRLASLRFRIAALVVKAGLVEEALRRAAPPGWRTQERS